MIIKNNQTLILGFFGNSLRVSLTAATFRKSLLTGLLV
ncbi:TPA: pilus assembly protein PilP, partial [Legionella pneumophila]|nr:pilus assembly protein PilP [Legionella pneumophila]